MTLDFHTVKITPPTVSLRDRDTTGQLRIPLSEVAGVIDKLVGGMPWGEMSGTYQQQDAWAEAHPLE